MGICQDLVSQVGFGGGYQTVKRFVRKLRGSQTSEACAVIVTVPGEKSQVDYGWGPMVRDLQSGNYIDARGCMGGTVRVLGNKPRGCFPGKALQPARLFVYGYFYA